MNFKIISLLIMILVSMGTISTVASLEFDSSTLFTDNFDILGVFSDDLDGDGENEILAYTSGKKLLCLDDRGNIKWALESNNSYSMIKIMDIYDSPGNEIVVGTENRVVSKNEVYNALVYFLEANGTELAVIPIVGSILDVDVGDVDSNGTYETVIGADDGTVYLFDEGLNFLWDYETRGYNFRTVITDLNEDGENEVLVVAWDNSYLLDSRGKLTKSYVTKNILRKLYFDKFNNMIHVSRWYREDTQDWRGTFVYSLNRNLAPMWEFKTETDAVASGFFDINNDGKEEIILGGNKGEIIVLDSKGGFTKRFDLPDRIFKVGVINDQNQSYLIAGSKDNNLYILNPESGNVEYKFTTGGWVETFFVKDINNDGKDDILIGSDDNKIYILAQKKDIVPNNDQNKSQNDIPVEPQKPSTETKNTPFGEAGIIGGALLAGIYLALRNRR